MPAPEGLDTPRRPARGAVALDWRPVRSRTRATDTAVTSGTDGLSVVRGAAGPLPRAIGLLVDRSLRCPSGGVEGRLDTNGGRARPDRVEEELAGCPEPHLRCVTAGPGGAGGRNAGHPRDGMVAVSIAAAVVGDPAVHTVTVAVRRVAIPPTRRRRLPIVVSSSGALHCCVTALDRLTDLQLVRAEALTAAWKGRAPAPPLSFRFTVSCSLCWSAPRAYPVAR